MSKKGINILLWILNLILVITMVLPFEAIPSIFQFIGRLHPLVLHFPIVLLITGFIFELLAKRKDDNYQKPADALLWAGALTAAFSALAGSLLSMNGEYSGNSFELHRYFGLGTSLISLLLVQLKSHSNNFFHIIYGALMLILIVTGHYGASLTHGEDFLTSVFREKPTINLDTSQPVFTQAIAPILDSKCVSCHNPSKLKGNLLLDSEAGILKGGESGAVLVPGDINKSLLTHHILLAQEDDKHMPPQGKLQLNNEEIKLLTWWVENEASFTQTISEINQEDPIQGVFTTYFAEAQGPNLDFIDNEVIIDLNNERVQVRQISDDEPYIEVRISNRQDLSRSDLKKLKRIRKNVVSIDLGNSEVTGKVIQELKKFSNLKRLYLDNTSVDDTSIGQLSKLKSLEYLNLYGTNVGIDGAVKVADLPKLQQLFLWQTNVKSDELEGLATRFPNIEINGGLSESSAFASVKLAAPKLTFESNFFNDQIVLETNYGLSDTDIYYQVNDEAPKLVENGIITLNRSASLSIVAKKEGWEDSDPIEEAFIKVAPNQIKKSDLQFGPKGSYKAKGVNTLFDLKKGSEDFKDGQWLGFNGDDLVLNLELEQTKEVSRVFVSTMENLGSWIFPSQSIEVWAGTTSNNMVKLQDLKLEGPGGPEPSRMKIHRLEFSPKQVKHLRLVVKNYGTLPEWHPGKGNPTWLFVDEVIIE